MARSIRLALALSVTLLGAASGSPVVFTQPQVGGVPSGTVQGPVPGPGGPRGGPGGAPPPGSVPTRDRDVTMTAGTSRLRGRIVAADTGRPLRRSMVRLSAPGVRETRSTSTDQDGQYEFTDLPAATYTVMASKSGYVSMGYKQTRPGSMSSPVGLGAGETKERVDVALMPAGVITGRVVDEYGEPVADTMVSAQRQQFVNGARRPMPSGAPSSSNDIGEFRVHGLAPGEYYVYAAPRGPFGPADANTDRTGYAPAYYPSAQDVASAQRVTVRSGDHSTASRPATTF
jgi:hypothetical protein